MTTIGIEEHFNTPDIRAALHALPSARHDDSVALNEMGETQSFLEDLGDRRLAAMDEQGIDMQVLALAPPATQALDANLAIGLSRQANDLAAAAVRRHPDRFRAMATLPLVDPAAAAEELERATGLGLVGTMVYGRTGDVPLDDPRYDDLLGVAAAMRHPVFIHPQIAPPAVRAASYDGISPEVDFALATYGWGWHLEAAIAALRLIAHGALDRHPDLQLVLGHWGELLLFWSERTAGVARAAKLQRTMDEYIRSNVHITVSGMLSPTLLHHALEVTTIDRLLLSTDFPFQQPTSETIAAFLTEFGSDSDRDQFASGNARSLFRIEQSGGGT